MEIDLFFFFSCFAYFPQRNGHLASQSFTCCEEKKVFVSKQEKQITRAIFERYLGNPLIDVSLQVTKISCICCCITPILNIF